MIAYNTFTLPNGLRVIHNYDPSTAMVTVNTLYATGSRDEDASTAGIAHLFEHLMFGGSANVSDFSAEIQRAGGNDNAWTSQDFTNFHTTIPAHNIETALRAESDRLLAPDLASHILDTQKKVVTEEFKQSLNRPYGDLYHHLLGALYHPDHPYSHPVIGIRPEMIDGLPEDQIREWFERHYTPSNAVLALAGNLRLEDGRRLVEKWYGDIPARHPACRHLPEQVFRQPPAKVTVRGRVAQTVVLVAVPMAAYGTEQYFAADILSDILSEGRAARFQQNLVDKPGAIFTKAEACISGYEHEGFMLLTGYMASENSADIGAAPEILINEASKLAIPGNITPEETSRVLNRHESRRSLDLLTLPGRASTLATALFHNEDINDEMPRLRKMTLGSLEAHAGDIFANPPAIITYSPL